VTRGFPGAKNDKTIVRYDLNVARVRDDHAYSDMEYELMAADGSTYTERGAYLIVDGGYHKASDLRH
jgi:hypothetical protein